MKNGEFRFFSEIFLPKNPSPSITKNCIPSDNNTHTTAIAILKLISDVAEDIYSDMFNVPVSSYHHIAPKKSIVNPMRLYISTTKNRLVIKLLIHVNSSSHNISAKKSYIHSYI